MQYKSLLKQGSKQAGQVVFVMPPQDGSCKWRSINWQPRWQPRQCGQCCWQPKQCRQCCWQPNNAGNGRNGASKKAAGKRSGLKRSAKYCLVVKKKWLDLILAGSKDWEIRGCSAQRRGWFHFAESGSGGKLVGRARLVDCLNLSKGSFMKNFHRHRVPSWAQVKYKSVYAWVPKGAERFERPFKYDHTQGAMIWVKVRGSAL